MGWELPPFWLVFTVPEGVMQAAEGAMSLTIAPNCEP